MAKQDVLDAINATVSSNNVKGITADSLNNVLTMMVENAGEGGGSGESMMKIFVPDYGMFLGPEFIREGEFTPALVSEMRNELETQMPEMIDAYEALFTAFDVAFVNNANVFASIKEKAKNGEGCSVLLDQSMITKATIDMQMSLYPEAYSQIEEYILSLSQICNVGYMCMKYNPDVNEPTTEQLVLSPNIESNSGMGLYPSNMGILVQPDGSIIFEKIVSNIDYELYVSLEGEEIDTYYKEDYNLKIRNDSYDALGKSVQIRNYNGNSYITVGRFLIHEVIENEGFIFFEGDKLKKCTIDSRGNATIAIIGSISGIS
jgi:hypothetical protein